jgi:tRNA threonylcarbamoyladenosine biosynthesis protein TsaB
MNILCIETSASLCSVAILKEEEVFYCDHPKTMGHAEVLMDLINTGLATAGIKTKQLDAVALSGGPGSYTGLRIGCSSAKGICYALGIPLIALDTLKIVAYAARKNNPGSHYFWAMMDARRMEVYHALFNQDLEQLTTTQSGIITDTDFVPNIAKNNKVMSGLLLMLLLCAN